MKVEVQSPYNRIMISYNREGHSAFAVFLLSFFVGMCRGTVSDMRCRSPPLHLDFYISKIQMGGINGEIRTEKSIYQDLCVLMFKRKCQLLGQNQRLPDRNNGMWPLRII